MIRRVRARVVAGRRLGRALGFPTANLRPLSGRLPPRGVYRVSVSGAGLRERVAVCNVGLRPTVEGGAKRLLAEVHIPRFRADLYGKTLRVTFLQKLRSERKFPSLGALKAQLKRDVRRATKTTN